MNWKRMAIRLAILAATIALLLYVSVNPAVAVNVAPLFHLLFLAAVGDTVWTVTQLFKKRNLLALYFASSLGGRYRGMSSIIGSGFALIFSIISAIISFVIVAKMFPLIDSAAYDLQQAASKSNNTLIKMLAPIIPYIIGAGLFVMILIPVNMMLDRIASRIGVGRGSV